MGTKQADLDGARPRADRTPRETGRWQRGHMALAGAAVGILGIGSGAAIWTNAAGGSTSASPATARSASPSAEPRDGSRDSYSCFTGCSSALTSSTICRQGRDYSITVTDKRSRVVVMSFHGGLIEHKASGVSLGLSRRFGWSRYDFNGHATSGCLAGKSQFSRLHVTSPHFNDPALLRLVASAPTAVSIHGYSPYRGLSTGEVCVGGGNQAEVDTFISALAANAGQWSDYELRGVTASGAAGCSDLTGTGPLNPINRNRNGGLQLEMSPQMKTDLTDSSSSNDSLRDAVYGAIGTAMSQG
ncbi:MAG: phage-related protein [Acidimicrobiales bacterium]|nr:phage-related protein [Acidimicrobiales bacterium]